MTDQIREQISALLDGELARDELGLLVRRMEREITGFSQSALDALLRHTWPGNIRELEHAIECACAVARGSEIDIADLPDDVVRDRSNAPLGSLRERERAVVRAALARNGGNRRATAAELGVSLSTLKRRLKR